jgi:hypothetical protein
LGEENDTKLKMPAELEADKQAAGGRETVEASKMATTEMAENAGESPTKVSKKKNIGTRNEIILNMIRKKNLNIVSVNK